MEGLSPQETEVELELHKCSAYEIVKLSRQRVKMEKNPAYGEVYGGPEGPCPLPITIFPITNFDFSHYQLPIWLFLVSNFEFSHYQLPIWVFPYFQFKVFTFNN